MTKVQVVEGSEFSDYTHKESGHETGQSQSAPDGHVVRQRDVSGMDSVYVTQGITVELARFESARVDVGVRACFERNEEEVWRGLRLLVAELLAREEASLRGQERRRVDVEFNHEVWGCGVYVRYGLTLKGEKQYESHRFDISRYRQIEDGADILKAIQDLGAEVEHKVSEQRDAIQGDGSAMGL